MTDVLIIGCGAAGAAAAIAAAEAGRRVIVLDRNRRPLKKLGVTGNGRGNLLNLGEPRYYGEEAFARSVLTAMPREGVVRFWENLGVTLTEEGEGRVYPAAYMASVAVDALLLRMEELGVTILSNTAVKALTVLPEREALPERDRAPRFRLEAVEAVYGDEHLKSGGKVKKGGLLAENDRVYEARQVIVAAGGKAAAVHGTDGGAYRLLTELGHGLSAPRPALCPLVTEAALLKGLSGQRVRARLTLAGRDGEHVAQGEALFADDGVSGIAAMQLARFAQKGDAIRLDMREAVFGDPSCDIEAALDERIAALAARPAERLLTGAVTPRLNDALLKAAGLDRNGQTAGTLNTRQRRALARAIGDFSLTVLGTRGFDAAQVTAGGIIPGEFDRATMESRLISGLYAAGEILDVDGDCGGYNLMFAVASGLLAGRAAGAVSP